MFDIPLFDFSNYKNTNSIISKTYVEDLLTMDDIVICEMLDGELMSISENYIWSFNCSEPVEKEYNKPIYKLQEVLKDWIGDFEIIGLNQTAIRQIRYDNLQDFFYVIAIRKDDRYVSWNNVVLLCEILNLNTIPVRKITNNYSFSFNDHVGQGIKNEASRSSLDSHDPLTGVKCDMYGVYVRNQEAFHVNDYINNHYLYIKKGRIILGPRWERTWRRASIKGTKKYFL